MSVVDEPKALANAAVREARLGAIHQPHIAPLTDLVDALRSRMGPNCHIPYFDPLDGGINAECLFLLEAPGPNAIRSGFVSRNNPDETARNFFLLNSQAGIDRSRTVIWNVVPWYVGTGTNIRAVSGRDIEAALPSLGELFGLLRNLRVVALVGRKAATVRTFVVSQVPEAVIFETPHPSPMFVNRNPANRDVILAVLRRIADHLQELPGGG